MLNSASDHLNSIVYFLPVGAASFAIIMTIFSVISVLLARRTLKRTAQDSLNKRILAAQQEAQDETKGERVIAAENWLRLHERFIETESRLQEALDRVRISSRLQLNLGLAFALLGFSYVVGLDFVRPKDDLAGHVPPAAVVEQPKEPSDGLSRLLVEPEFMSRLPSGIMIQIFSLFFLRLYRSSFDSTKYYHGELSNIQAFQAAVILAMTSSDKNFQKIALSKAITKFLEVDRNGDFLKNEKFKIDAVGKLKKSLAEAPVT